MIKRRYLSNISRSALTSGIEWNYRFSKGSFNLEKIPPNGYHGLASMCAWTLAHAHAKTGNRHMLAGYLGKGEAFEEAMLSYSARYADQNEADYDTFLKFSKG